MKKKRRKIKSLHSWIVSLYKNKEEKILRRKKRKSRNKKIKIRSKNINDKLEDNLKKGELLKFIEKSKFLNLDDFYSSSKLKN